MNPWKYANALRLVVTRLNTDMSFDSRSIDDPEVQDWLRAGNTVSEPDPPPPPTQDEQDADAAKVYPKLAALRGLTPAQVQTWIDANVNNLSEAKDAIKTLAIAVSVLLRRI